MKKESLIMILLIASVFTLIGISGFTSAVGCSLDASFVNQDPYPAVPSEEVKVVFQLSGVSNPICQSIMFEILPEYPFSLHPDADSVAMLPGGGKASDSSGVWLIPYTLRVDGNALDGESSIDVRYIANSGGLWERFFAESFNITVEDTRTDFEVSIKDYNPTTQIITFEILNIGKSDVEALTAEVPLQKNIDIKGSRRNISGSLDSNDDTTFTFEAIPREGEIKIVILYNDEINVRRQLEESVMFNPSDFQGRASQQKSYTGIIILVIIIVAVGGIWIWRRRVKKKRLDHLKNKHMHTH